MDLEDYRREVERVDRELVDAISRRINVVEELEDYKKQKDIESDSERVKERFEKLFQNKGLSKQKGKELAEFLISMKKDQELG